MKIISSNKINKNLTNYKDVSLQSKTFLSGVFNKYYFDHYKNLYYLNLIHRLNPSLKDHEGVKYRIKYESHLYETSKSYINLINRVFIFNKSFYNSYLNENFLDFKLLDSISSRESKSYLVQRNNFSFIKIDKLFSNFESISKTSLKNYNNKNANNLAEINEYEIAKNYKNLVKQNNQDSLFKKSLPNSNLNENYFDLKFLDLRTSKAEESNLVQRNNFSFSKMDKLFSNFENLSKTSLKNYNNNHINNLVELNKSEVVKNYIDLVKQNSQDSLFNKSSYNSSLSENSLALKFLDLRSSKERKSNLFLRNNFSFSKLDKLFNNFEDLNRISLKNYNKNVSVLESYKNKINLIEKNRQVSLFKKSLSNSNLTENYFDLKFLDLRSLKESKSNLVQRNNFSFTKIDKLFSNFENLNKTSIKNYNNKNANNLAEINEYEIAKNYKNLVKQNSQVSLSNKSLYKGSLTENSLALKFLDLRNSTKDRKNLIKRNNFSFSKMDKLFSNFENLSKTSLKNYDNKNINNSIELNKSEFVKNYINLIKQNSQDFLFNKGLYNSMLIENSLTLKLLDLRNSSKGKSYLVRKNNFSFNKIDKLFSNLENLNKISLKNYTNKNVSEFEIPNNKINLTDKNSQVSLFKKSLANSNLNENYFDIKFLNLISSKEQKGNLVQKNNFSFSKIDKLFSNLKNLNKTSIKNYSDKNANNLVEINESEITKNYKNLVKQDGQVSLSNKSLYNGSLTENSLTLKFFDLRNPSKGKSYLVQRNNFSFSKMDKLFSNFENLSKTSLKNYDNKNINNSMEINKSEVAKNYINLVKENSLVTLFNKGLYSKMLTKNSLTLNHLDKLFSNLENLNKISIKNYTNKNVSEFETSKNKIDLTEKNSEVSLLKKSLDNSNLTGNDLRLKFLDLRSSKKSKSNLVQRNNFNFSKMDKLFSNFKNLSKTSLKIYSNKSLNSLVEINESEIGKNYIDLVKQNSKGSLFNKSLYNSRLTENSLDLKFFDLKNYSKDKSYLVQRNNFSFNKIDKLFSKLENVNKISIKNYTNKNVSEFETSKNNIKLVEQNKLVTLFEKNLSKSKLTENCFDLKFLDLRSSKKSNLVQRNNFNFSKMDKLFSNFENLSNTSLKNYNNKNLNNLVEINESEIAKNYRNLVKQNSQVTLFKKSLASNNLTENYFDLKFLNLRTSKEEKSNLVQRNNFNFSKMDKLFSNFENLSKTSLKIYNNKNLNSLVEINESEIGKNYIDLVKKNSKGSLFNKSLYNRRLTENYLHIKLFDLRNSTKDKSYLIQRNNFSFSKIDKLFSNLENLNKTSHKSYSHKNASEFETFKNRINLVEQNSQDSLFNKSSYNNRLTENSLAPKFFDLRNSSKDKSYLVKRNNFSFSKIDNMLSNLENVNKISIKNHSNKNVSEFETSENKTNLIEKNSEVSLFKKSLSNGNLTENYFDLKLLDLRNFSKEKIYIVQRNNFSFSKMDKLFSNFKNLSKTTIKNYNYKNVDNLLELNKSEVDKNYIDLVKKNSQVYLFNKSIASSSLSEHLWNFKFSDLRRVEEDKKDSKMEYTRAVQQELFKIKLVQEDHHNFYEDKKNLVFKLDNNYTKNNNIIDKIEQDQIKFKKLVKEELIDIKKQNFHRINITKLTEEIYKNIESKLKFERQRRGML